MGSELPTIDQMAERRKKFDRVVSKPDAMEVIVGHISQGGSLASLAEIWDVRYVDLYNWVNDDKERFKLYQKGLEIREDWAKETILREFRRIGLADIRNIFRDDHTLKPINEWPAEITSCIAGIEVNELFDGYGEDRQQVGVAKKVKLWDKVKALENLAKNLALLTEKKEVSGHLTWSQMVEESYDDED